MPVKELHAEHNGKKIRVRNTWFSGIKLYVDGECRDRSYELFGPSAKYPILSSAIETEGGMSIVEVFVKAIITAKLQIRVDGEKIAGDDF